MDQLLRKHADEIVASAIAAVMPDLAVRRALEGEVLSGRVYAVAVGKAAWQMAKAASDCLGEHIRAGIVVTKYWHIKGEIQGFECYEAGHPVPDENSYLATQKVIDLVSGLNAEDTVLFLLSGGGSALFEKPLVPCNVLQDVTNQLLACGASITEINTIRKRLSAVKGGRFAQLCSPAQVFSVVLSDVLGDPLDMIASGPACTDSSCCEQALEIARKYALTLTAETDALLHVELPKTLDNVSSRITGSVRELCAAAERTCQKLGYDTVILTDMLACQAKEAGSFFSSILNTYSRQNKPVAFLAGGETIVKLVGKGKGGRNQELALAAAPGISALKGCAVFSFGSDGTDGPTDAAGGYVDCETYGQLQSLGIEVYNVLNDNDAYNALAKTDGLIITGPTGTNVNDVAVALYYP